jgi:hypothetical protein
MDVAFSARDTFTRGGSVRRGSAHHTQTPDHPASSRTVVEEAVVYRADACLVLEGRQRTATASVSAHSLSAAGVDMQNSSSRPRLRAELAAGSAAL